MSAWIGPYKVDKPIASGGVGVLYKAEDVEGKPVALKLLHQDLAVYPVLSKRFVREAQAMKGIRHENVVRVLDEGTAQDGRPFLVMELLHGRSLARALKDKRVDYGMARIVTKAIARGLAAAHSAGFIHRDVKPANVMLERTGGVKILDFGLVAVTEAADLVTRTKLTETGIVLGTPQYVAPEVACGDPATVRSDFYSLGVVLYEMLSGAVPFDGSVKDIFTHHLMTPPPPLPNDGVLERLTLELLKKRPNERPASAEWILQALA